MPDESKPARATGPRDGRDIASLTEAKITHAEARKLREAGVRTVAEFWEKVSRDGLGDLEQKAKIEGHRLVELLPSRLADQLADDLLKRAERSDIVSPTRDSAKWRLPFNRWADRVVRPFGRRAWRTAGRAGVWLREHLPDLMLLAGVALVALLAFRAVGSFSAIPPPWGLGARYAVAAHDLKKDRALRKGELHFVLLPPAANYFTDDDGLEGLILARDVPRQKPLRHEDLLRLQVVAVRDIAREESIAPSDLKLEWRPLQLTALTRAADAAQAKARLAIRKDEVVTEEHLAR